MSRARSRGLPDEWAVLQCKVNLGKVYDWSGTWWRKFDFFYFENGKYESVKGTHPPWVGINDTFIEYCLKNEKKCNVIGKITKNGTYVVVGGKSYLNGTIDVIFSAVFAAAGALVAASFTSALTISLLSTVYDMVASIFNLKFFNCPSAILSGIISSIVTVLEVLVVLVPTFIGTFSSIFWFVLNITIDYGIIGAKVIAVIAVILVTAILLFCAFEVISERFR